jgi:formylglycine-generating enzyme required for sulfatase activity
VSWDDAQAFCKKLSEKEKVMYRLPTEAEWEFACRGGEMARFSFGDDESKLSDYAWWGGNRGDGNTKYERYAHEVGLKKPNPFGLHDIHGNVWEWCEDVNLWLETFPGGTDPLVSTGGSDRVSRGGGWFWDAATCRSASRAWFPPESRSVCAGFRVALSSPQ